MADGGCTPGPSYPVMGNPLLESPISRGYLWVIPKNPKVEHNKYDGNTLLGVHPIVP